MTDQRPLTDRTVGVIRESVLADLRAMRTATPNDHDVQRLQAATSAFYDSLARLDSDIAAIQDDPHLTREGKDARRAELGKAWQATSAQTLADLDNALTAVAGQPDPIEIPAPVDDAALLEAKLANARSDARMLLDGVEPSQLPSRMQELVERNADPIVSYLLTATDWGVNYLRSRLPRQDRGVRANLAHRGNGQEGILLEWAHARVSLTPKMLDDTGRRKWERRQRLSNVARIPHVARETQRYVIRTRRL